MTINRVLNNFKEGVLGIPLETILRPIRRAPESPEKRFILKYTKRPKKSTSFLHRKSFSRLGRFSVG
jgi:hypothetical protein